MESEYLGQIEALEEKNAGLTDQLDEALTTNSQLEERVETLTTALHEVREDVAIILRGVSL